jgi:hypothetical protein
LIPAPKGHDLNHCGVTQTLNGYKMVEAAVKALGEIAKNHRYRLLLL